MNSPHEKQTEELMNAALASYSDVSPRAGFEKRIIARATSEAHATRAGFLWKWAAASCMAAALACAAVLAIPHHRDIETARRASLNGNIEQTPAAQPSQTTEMPVAVSFHKPHHMKHPASVAVVRRPIAQAPLSHDEELLLSVAAEHPEVLPHNVEHQNDPVRLLTISELNKPLSPEPPKQE